MINKQDVSSLIYNLGTILSNDFMCEENDGEVFLPTDEDILAIYLRRSHLMEKHMYKPSVKQKLKMLENNGANLLQQINCLLLFGIIGEAELALWIYFEHY